MWSVWCRLLARQPPHSHKDCAEWLFLMSLIVWTRYCGGEGEGNVSNYRGESRRMWQLLLGRSYLWNRFRNMPLSFSLCALGSCVIGNYCEMCRLNEWGKESVRTSIESQPCCFCSPGARMGCISLPGASGLQQLKRDVYGNQRDPGGLGTPTHNITGQPTLQNHTCALLDNTVSKNIVQKYSGSS